MTTMRPTTSTLRLAMPALLAAIVASIVLGIIGMHALSSTHGVTGMSMGTTDHSAMTNPVTSPTTGTTHMSAVRVTGPITGRHAGKSSTAAVEGDGHSLGSMVMLCSAMLVAAGGALLLLLLGLRRTPRVWTHRLPAPITMPRWVTARLGTGPPYVWNFSVIRC